MRQSIGSARISAQFRIRKRVTNTTTSAPPTHWTQRHQCLATERLAVPALEVLCHPSRSELHPPPLAGAPRLLAPPRRQGSANSSRNRPRVGIGDDSPSPDLHGGDHAASVAAYDHR